jgi:hypothetical protein
MPVTVQSFRARFPEFNNIEDFAIAEIVAEAERRTDESVWQELREDGVKYLAAHLAATSPFSAELKLVDKGGDTRYGIERRRLEVIVSSGFRVAVAPWLG